MKGVYKQTGHVALNQEDYESLLDHQEYILSNGIAMELDITPTIKRKKTKKTKTKKNTKKSRKSLRV